MNATQAQRTRSRLIRALELITEAAVEDGVFRCEPRLLWMEAHEKTLAALARTYELERSGRYPGEPAPDPTLREAFAGLTETAHLEHRIWSAQLARLKVAGEAIFPPVNGTHP